MKKIFTLFVLFSVLSTFAQITINRVDYGAIGDYVKFAVDTPASATLNSTILKNGANQTWNFAGVTTNKYDSSVFKSPSILPVHPDSANLLLVSATGQQFQYVDSNFMKVILDRPNNNIKNLSLKIFKFPIQYNSNFIDSFTYVKKGVPADFNAPFLATIGYDSVTAIIKANNITSCVGWGNIQLPDTSCNVLALRITTVSDIALFGHVYSVGWSNINSLAGIVPHQKTVEYQWIGKNSKSFIARATMDTNGLVVKSFTYALKKNLPTIVSVTNNSAERGQTLNIAIIGNATHFNQANINTVKIYQGNSNLIINSVTAINDTILNVNISVAQSNPLGLYDVKVIDLIYGDIIKSAAFEVRASTHLPQLISVTPNIISDRPQTLDITITGAYTHFLKGPNMVSFYFNDTLSLKIIVNSFNAVNDTTLICNITTNGVNAGSYDIHTNNTIDGTLMLNKAFGFVTGVNNLHKPKQDITVYPNPASDDLFVIFNQPILYNFITITDVSGRLVKSINTNASDITINTADLKSGLYFINIWGNELNISRKVIIQH